MATTTAPPAPAAPEPATEQAAPAPSQAPPSSTLARVFTPVQPARPTTPIGTTATLTQDGGDTATHPGKAQQDAPREGAVSALLRGIGERLRRTGTTTNIKRTHAVTETRVSGNSSTTTNAHKADRSAKHTGNTDHRSNRDTKLADLKNKASQQQGRNNRDVKKADTTDSKASDARATKDDSSSATKNGKDQREARDTKLADTRSAKNDTATRSTPDRSDTKTLKPDSPAGTPATPKTPPAPRGPGGPTAPPKGPVADPKGLDSKTRAQTPRPEAAPAGPRPRTQDSRETGYRDGHRAAATVGHVKAWRDGARDGWDDRTAADQADKRTMDDNRARNATRPKPAAPVAPASGSTVDLTKKPDAAAAAQPVVPPKPTSPPTVGTAQDQAPKTEDPAAKAAANTKPVVPEKKTAPADTPGKPGAGKDTAPGPKPPAPAKGSTVSLAKTSAPAPTAPSSGPSGTGRQTMAPATPSTPGAAAEQVPNPRTALPTFVNDGAHSPLLTHPKPAENIAVTADSVTFTPGYRTEPHTMSRGEVRTLRQFERRLEDKQAVLTQVAEDSKTAREHAEAHAKTAQELAEAAKAVKGGIALVTALHRLAEQARQLHTSATEAERYAVRGAEAVKVTAGNARTRHGGIYQAVVDSPLTSPAERTFYTDQQGS